jgi:hypothetical protein
LHTDCHSATQSSLALSKVHVRISSSIITISPHSVKAMHLAFVVDNATYFYNPDCHEIAPPPTKVVKYPNMDFLKSISLAIYAYVYPSNTGLSLAKHKLQVEVLLRYISIHFIVNQCSLQD